jgi:hypothetical protein
MADHIARSERESEKEEPPSKSAPEDQHLLDEQIKTLPLRVQERIKQRRPEMDDDTGPGMDWID